MKWNVRGGAPLVCQPFAACVTQTCAAAWAHQHTPANRFETNSDTHSRGLKAETLVPDGTRGTSEKAALRAVTFSFLISGILVNESNDQKNWTVLALCVFCSRPNWHKHQVSCLCTKKYIFGTISCT